MSLEPYQRKRRFDRTPEPAGKVQRAGKQPVFVIQKHAASRLHYDFRLEHAGVLKSWAVPKGPSLDPKEKRLAVEVEDHPLEYGKFEGIIPQGEYGGGTVLVWDRGVWTAEGNVEEGFREGKLSFELEGEKLRGGWSLIRMPRRGNQSAKNWLLIKRDDEAAQPLAVGDVLQAQPQSVASGRTLSEIADAKTSLPKPKQNKVEPQRAKSKKSTTSSRRATKPRLSSTSWQARLEKITSAKQAPLPPSVKPALATLAANAPEGEQWLHEIKLDGYRLICRKERSQVQFTTRSGNDWTAKFLSLVPLIGQLPARQAILDGEAVVLESDGTTSFQALQNAFRRRATAQVVYYIFDLLYLDGYDLRSAPLKTRKALLTDLIAAAGPLKGRVLLSEHLVGHGPDVLHQACHMGLEGIVSKRGDRPYPAGRSAQWIKSKCVNREEFVIGGFTAPSGARAAFGALLLGYYEPDGSLRYVGRVGTGFTEQTLRDLHRQLRKLEIKTSPFAKLSAAEAGRGVHWVKPELVAQVEFGSWTDERILRHAVFNGLREDKPANEVTREDQPTPAFESSHAKPEETKAKRTMSANRLPAALQDMRFTNPGRVIYPEQGITKLGLATYYALVADWLLPHVKDRPLSLVRCPQGRHKTCFYQKHAPEGLSDFVDRVEIPEQAGRETYVAIHDLAGLLSLVQFGVLEIHVWGARRDQLEKPDRLILDLDPDPTVEWPRVIEAAQALRNLLEELQLTSFVKTTGGKGLHVVVPLVRRTSWEQAKQFAKAVGERMVAIQPRHYTTNASKAARRGKIYIDYLRNARGATAIAPYSTRSRPGAPVSVPLAWQELPAQKSPDQYTVENLPRRLAALDADPWKELPTTRQSITCGALEQLGL